MSVPADFADQVRRMVERTCAEQGLSPAVTDRATIERVAVLLQGGRR